MASDYVPPQQGHDGFNCPHCGAYAHQTWGQTRVQGEGTLNPDVLRGRCGRCDQDSLWIGGTLIFPPVLVAPKPHEDLPSPALEDYQEARSIAALSPRAAAALLRLCIQRLVPVLGAKSDHLDTAIGELVKMGLSPVVQQSLDAVRVIGNNAVHPGTIDLTDNPSMALALFDLVNLIVQTMITDPKAIRELYDRLPEGARDHIDKRDG